MDNHAPVETFFSDDEVSPMEQNPAMEMPVVAESEEPVEEEAEDAEDAEEEDAAEGASPGRGTRREDSDEDEMDALLRDLPGGIGA